MSSGKCSCNLGYLVLALILFTLGLFSLVAGFGWQFNSVSRTGDGAAGMVLVAYFVGFLLVAFGKMAKWKSHAECKVHSMK